MTSKRSVNAWSWINGSAGRSRGECLRSLGLSSHGTFRLLLRMEWYSPVTEGNRILTYDNCVTPHLKRYSAVALNSSDELVASFTSPFGTKITIPFRARVNNTRYAFVR